MELKVNLVVPVILDGKVQYLPLAATNTREYIDTGRCPGPYVVHSISIAKMKARVFESLFEHEGVSLEMDLLVTQEDQKDQKVERTWSPKRNEEGRW